MLTERFGVRWRSARPSDKSASPSAPAFIPARSRSGGGDIGGIAVHAASRVMTQSLPDEVLVSRVVTDFVAGAGLTFAERGSHELKGLPGLLGSIRRELNEVSARPLEASWGPLILIRHA